MWRKISTWLLPLSLALNLFFVIVAARHYPWGRPRMMAPHEVMLNLKANLSPEDAAILQQSFAAHQAEIEHGTQHFPDRIRAALAAEPFDPEALRAALDDGRALHQKMEESMASALVDAASKISPEGRVKLAAGGFRHHMGPPPPPR